MLLRGWRITSTSRPHFVSGSKRISSQNHFLTVFWTVTHTSLLDVAVAFTTLAIKNFDLFIECVVFFSFLMSLFIFHTSTFLKTPNVLLFTEFASSYLFVHSLAKFWVFQHRFWSFCRSNLITYRKCRFASNLLVVVDRRLLHWAALSLTDCDDASELPVGVACQCI